MLFTQCWSLLQERAQDSSSIPSNTIKQQYNIQYRSREHYFTRKIIESGREEARPTRPDSNDDFHQLQLITAVTVCFEAQSMMGA